MNNRLVKIEKKKKKRGFQTKFGWKGIELFVNTLIMTFQKFWFVAKTISTSSD